MTEGEKKVFLKKLIDEGVELIFSTNENPVAIGFRHKTINVELTYIAENIKHVTQEEWKQAKKL